jgi:hypothetical protein
MMWKSKIAAGAALAVSVTAAVAASGISVRQVAKVNGNDAAVWAKIGGFCAIKDWHPALAGCEETKEGDATFRTLTLKDGGKIKEKLTGTSATGYTYQIVDGPLPVKDYSASFSARADNDEPGKAIVVWSASFAAKGKPDSEARGVIEGIFKDGLKSISDGAAK